MNTDRDLPYFRYHPDPIGSESISEEDCVCSCCGEHSNYQYEDPVFGDSAVLWLCPWCIANGEASKQLGIHFIDPENQIHSKLPPEVLEELTQRTPGIFLGDELEWPVHCNDACAFIRKTENIESYQKMIAEGYSLGIGSLKPWSSVELFRFECLHCDEEIYRGYIIADKQSVVLSRKKLLAALDQMLSLPEVLNQSRLLKILEGMRCVMQLDHNGLFDSAHVGESREALLGFFKNLLATLDSCMSDDDEVQSQELSSLCEYYRELVGLYYNVYADCVDARPQDRKFIASLTTNSFREYFEKCKALVKAGDEISLTQFKKLREDRSKITDRKAEIRQQGGLPSSLVNLNWFALYTTDEL